MLLLINTVIIPISKLFHISSIAEFRFGPKPAIAVPSGAGAWCGFSAARL
jgi:hypothetical protein